MTYVSEEVHPKSIGLAMGLFIGGNAIGGMTGRLLTGFLTDLAGWRFAMAVIGVLGLLAAIGAWASLPASSQFRPRRSYPVSLVRSFAAPLRDSGLCCLFALAFLLMGAFVTIYNYLGFRLLAPPYGFSQTAIGAIFTIYLIGTASSAWIGDFAGRVGRHKVLWTMIAIMVVGVGLTLSSSIVLILVGTTVVTFGFFGGHSVASSWVGRRAQESRAQASAIYLFCYYAGSSAVGTLGGLFWTAYSWPGVTGLVLVLLGIAFAVSLWLSMLPPIARADAAPGVDV
jgi:MFS transporter, YNFM family, putative membrane transport protein